MEGVFPARINARRLVDCDELAGVVAELLVLMRDSGLARTLSIGRLVLERFFGGSFEMWRDRRRNKNNSVRRLADTPSCPLSRSALNQAIGVFAAVELLPGLRALDQIGPSHIVVVLPLSSDQREDWLRLANEERWSVRRLEDELHRHRRDHGERRGRPRTTQVAKVLTRLHSSLRRAELALNALAELDLRHDEAASELVELSTRLARATERAVELRQAARSESALVLKAAPAQLLSSAG